MGYRALRPVLVYIHGGGFVTGGASSPLLDGAAFAKRGDACVVTINFRLGVLGFLCHPELAAVKGKKGKGCPTGNWGLLDIVQALQWVQSNIHVFGGDKDKVTLIGHGSGGSAVISLLGASLEGGPLFHRAVVMSGPPNCISAEQAHQATEAFCGSLLGGAEPYEWLAGLQEMKAATLVEAQGSIWKFGGADDGCWLGAMGCGVLALRPVLGAAVVDCTAEEVAQSGAAAGVDVLCCMCDQEGTGLPSTAVEHQRYLKGECEARDLPFSIGKLLSQAWGSQYDVTVAGQLVAGYRKAQDEGMLDDPMRSLWEDYENMQGSDREREQRAMQLRALSSRVRNAQLYAAIAGDALVGRPLMEWARLHQQSGGTLYSLCLDNPLPWSETRGATWSLPWSGLGSSHGTDIPSLFGTAASLGLQEQSDLAQQLQGIMCAFAFCGEPNSVGWLPVGSAGSLLGPWPSHSARETVSMHLRYSQQTAGSSNCLKQLLVNTTSISELWRCLESGGSKFLYF